MSGPKVVRIVTAEELLALREAMLHRLDQAVARWQAQCERVGESDALAVAAVMARSPEQIDSLRSRMSLNRRAHVAKNDLSS